MMKEETILNPVATKLDPFPRSYCLMKVNFATRTSMGRAQWDGLTVGGQQSCLRSTRKHTDYNHINTSATKMPPGDEVNYNQTREVLPDRGGSPGKLIRLIVLIVDQEIADG